MTEKNTTDYFITVAVFNYAHELSIIRSRIEAEGIECKTIDELTVQVNPLYSPAIGGVKLQVKESDARQAIEILKEGGYVSDKDFEKSTSKTLSFIEKHTSKIPFLKNYRLEVRVMVIITVIVILFSIITILMNSANTY